MTGGREAPWAPPAFRPGEWRCFSVLGVSVAADDGRDHAADQSAALVASRGTTWRPTSAVKS